MSYKPVPKLSARQDSVCSAVKPRAVSSPPPPPSSLPLAGVRSRAHSGRSHPAVRQNAVDLPSEFDESEYCIVHSNAVETTPFYPAASAATTAVGAVGGAVRSSVSSSASTASSSRGASKSRKSSGGSSATSRLRRELRKSALEAAAVAAVSTTPSSPSSANIFANLKGFFSKWLHESKTSNGGGGGAGGSSGMPSASTGSDLDGASTAGDAFDAASMSAAASDCGGDNAYYLNIACPQYPQECSSSDLLHARNVMSMNSSIDSDYLLHFYTSLSPSSACSVSTASTNGDFFVSGSSCRGGVEDCLSDGGSRPQQQQQQQQLQQQQQQQQPNFHCQQLQYYQQHPVQQQQPQQQQQHLHLQHPTVQWDVQVDYDLLQRRNPRHISNRLRAAPEQQSTLVPPPAKSKSLQSQTARQQKDLLCSTWPPSGRRLHFALEEDEYMLTGVNCFHVIDSVMRNSRGSFEVKEFEFNIPHEDIEFRECVLRGRRRKVYRGHWHGEVTIHAYESLDSEERSKFWEEIAKLSLIRHENIFLFMGVSMDPPTSRFAVVTCLRKGVTLHETVHVRKEKLGASRRLSIIRDLAQAAGYLHAKSIVIRRFNSSNVFLEPRAKLSLQDYSVITEEEEDRPGYLIVPESLVWYTPPEILALLTGKTTFVPDSAFTVATDIFAFSIIMFEVCCGRYPFGKCDRLRYMEHICRGERDPMHDLRASESIKSLITDCWSHDPLYRPEFGQINLALNHREAAHLRHSSSEPENLHRHAKIGFF